MRQPCCAVPHGPPRRRTLQPYPHVHSQPLSPPHRPSRTFLSPVVLAGVAGANQEFLTQYIDGPYGPHTMSLGPFWFKSTSGAGCNVLQQNHAAGVRPDGTILNAYNDATVMTDRTGLTIGTLAASARSDVLCFTFKSAAATLGGASVGTYVPIMRCLGSSLAASPSSSLIKAVRGFTPACDSSSGAHIRPRNALGYAFGQTMPVAYATMTQIAGVPTGNAWDYVRVSDSGLIWRATSMGNR